MLKYNTLYTPHLPRTSDVYIRHEQAYGHITANHAGTKKTFINVQELYFDLWQNPKPTTTIPQYIRCRQLPYSESTALL